MGRVFQLPKPEAYSALRDFKREVIDKATRQAAGPDRDAPILGEEEFLDAAQRLSDCTVRLYLIDTNGRLVFLPTFQKPTKFESKIKLLYEETFTPETKRNYSEEGAAKDYENFMRYFPCFLEFIIDRVLNNELIALKFDTYRTYRKLVSSLSLEDTLAQATSIALNNFYMGLPFGRTWWGYFFADKNSGLIEQKRISLVETLTERPILYSDFEELDKMRRDFFKSEGEEEELKFLDAIETTIVKLGIDPSDIYALCVTRPGAASCANMRWTRDYFRLAHPIYRELVISSDWEPRSIRG